MGIHDRDWYRDDDTPQRRVAGMGGPMDARGEMSTRLRGWSITTWLLVINIAVFLIDIPLEGRLGYLGYCSIDTLRGGQVWRLITFQFLHAHFLHLAFNMIGLFFFGPMIESYLGSKRFAAFYLLCGLSGALTYVGLWTMGVLVGSAQTPLVGASAGIFGILAAGAVIAPNARVLIYGIIPMKLKTLALLLIGYGVYMVLTGGNNAGGEAGHLGGALLGFLLIRNARWLDWADAIGRGGSRGGAKRERARPGVTERRGPPSDDDAEIDRILDKISREGLNSLTDDEKRTLAQDTERKRGR